MANNPLANQRSALPEHQVLDVDGMNLLSTLATIYILLCQGYRVLMPGVDKIHGRPKRPKGGGGDPEPGSKQMPEISRQEQRRGAAGETMRDGNVTHVNFGDGSARAARRQTGLRAGKPAMSPATPGSVLGTSTAVVARNSHGTITFAAQQKAFPVPGGKTHLTLLQGGRAQAAAAKTAAGQVLTSAAAAAPAAKTAARLAGRVLRVA